jgi:apolipoprotein N-acyltransferase
MVATLLLSVLSGVIFSLSFKPVGLWFAAPIAFSLLFYILQRRSQPIISALVFAFISNLVVLSWTSTFVGALPWLLLATLQALYFIPLGIAARYTKSTPIYIFIVLFLESVKARFPFGGFSWTKIAFSQVDSPFAPLISSFGAITLSFITLMIVFMVLERSKSIAGLLIGFLFIAHFTNVQPLTSELIKVRAVQGGVPERGLDFNARAMQVLDNHIAVTIKEFDGSEDVIIWPENAIDVDPLRNEVVAKKIAALAKVVEKPLITGAILDGDRLLNTTILFNRAGVAKSIYVKRYLTPFGEYIPLRTIARLVSDETDRVTDFSAGDELVVHDVNGAKVGSTICYEIINDGLVREMASNSDLLIVQTNSATFSGSAEGEQQLAITRLRAMESKRNIISISTTGPSAVIDARGVVLSKLQDGQVGSLAASVPLTTQRSLAMRLGGFGELSVLLLSFGWALLSLRKGRKK